MNTRTHEETRANDVIDRIKAAARISDVAAQYGEVKPGGTERSVCRCLCGQNSDRHPSFMLYESDDHFHCFACGRHGSVIDLVMLAENCDLRTAIEKLKQRYIYGDAAADTPRTVARPAAPVEIAKVVSPETRAVLNTAVAHYQHVLAGNTTALYYLKNAGPDGRGLSVDTITRLRIGYSDGQTLARALHGSGVNLGLGAQVGLLTQYGEMMRSRLVFPVLEGDDAVFMIGRALRKEQEPKYLGLSDGLAHKQPMQCGQPDRGVVIVEGPFDYAALVQWRLDAHFQLMALLGVGHTRAVNDLLLMRPKPRVLIALDQDQAGHDAALKLMSTLTDRGIRTTILTWPGAKDCGELLQQGDHGKGIFERSLEKAGA